MCMCEEGQTSCWVGGVPGWTLVARSASVVTAILEEVKPHACALKKARSKLQKSVDDAKAGRGSIE